MTIRKIVSRSIGTDVIVADDLANNAVTTVEIQDGAVTQAKLHSGVSLGVGAFLGDNASGVLVVTQQMVKKIFSEYRESIGH